MNQVEQLVLVTLLSYAAGCIVAGYYLARWRVHSDIRLTGSGSAGARNVARLMGSRFGVMAFSWDFVKGAFAVLITTSLVSSQLAVGAASLAVVAGHVWPVQLQWRGGKGVAPAAGALAVWHPATLLVVAAVYLLSSHICRRIDRRAVIAFGAGLVMLVFSSTDLIHGMGCAMVFALLIWTHRIGALPQNFIDRKSRMTA